MSAIQRASLVGEAAPTTIDRAESLFIIMSTAAAVAGPVVATGYAVAKRALSPSGVLGAWLIGVATGGASHRMAVHLYFFFLSSSRITRVGEALKARIEGEFKKVNKLHVLLMHHHPHTQCPHSPVDSLVHLLFRFLHLLLRQYAAAI